MANNYTRGSETFRSTEVGGLHQPHVLVGAKQRTYKGVQSLVLTTTAQSLTVPGTATHADIYMEGGAADYYCRYWHGTAPTSTVGKKLKDHEEISSASPATFQAILASGTGTLRVEFYAYE